MKKLIFVVSMLLSVCGYSQSFRPEGSQLLTADEFVNDTARIDVGVGFVIVNPNNPITTGVMVFPSAPADRDVLYVLFGGQISNGNPVITTLEIISETSDILGSPVTTANAGDIRAWMYSAKTNAWYRLY